MASRRPKRQAIEFAEPDEVREFASGLSDSMVECRELGHLWRPWTASWSKHEGCFDRALRCSRCKTKRHQKLSDKGAVLTNSYEYPEGYLHAGLGRIAGDGRDVLRLESLQRSVRKTDEKKLRSVS